MDACKLLVHTLVMVRLDYCNALLCGAREDVIRQLERLQRQAARVVCKKYKNDHNSVTELMWGLHWLPIRARIQYKILIIINNNNFYCINYSQRLTLYSTYNKMLWPKCKQAKYAR